MSPRLVWSQELRRLVPAPEEGEGDAVPEPQRTAVEPRVTSPRCAPVRRRRAGPDLSALRAAADAHAEAVRRTAAASRARSEAIAAALEAGASLGQVAAELGISRVTVLRLAQSVRDNAAGA